MANTTGRKFGGRKKGTPNKDTKALRERIEALLDDQWHQLLRDIKQLKPKERVDMVIRLLEYALPKLHRSEIRETSTVEELLAMTPEQRRTRIEELRKQLESHK